METKGTTPAVDLMETAEGARDKEIEEKDEQTSPRTYAQILKTAGTCLYN
jgi:hypothetical protein